MSQHTPGEWFEANGTGRVVALHGEQTIHNAPNSMRAKGGDAEEVANSVLIAAAPDGLAAAKLALAWMSKPNAGPSEEFDRLAEQFRRETGFARPGKDLAPADPQNMAEREAAWVAWRREKQQAVYAALSAFVEKAEPTRESGTGG